MDLLDFLTLLSYVALNIDIIFQTIRIHKTKSSKYVSLFGLAVRYIGIVIILVKFISLRDTALVIGQGLIAITFTAYFILAVSYFRHRK